MALLCLAILPVIQATGQSVDKDQLAIEYISQYKDIAVKEMNRTGIPASITLAQGLHESDYGRSRLAVAGKNHFGIKCKKGWKGKTIKHTDDAPNECFRRFDSVYESYINHSDFLTGRKRYAFLFDFDRYDYKNWAFGLKLAGYATDQYYAYKLINIIEKYSLYIYDKMEYIPIEQAPIVQKRYPSRAIYKLVALNSRPTNEVPIKRSRSVLAIDYKIGQLPEQKKVKVNGVEALRYPIEVWPVQISEVYDITLEELLELNDMEYSFPIPAFTNIYLEERKKKSHKQADYHVVRMDEDLREVALTYGIDQESLRLRNNLDNEMELAPGEVVYLRKKAPYRAKVYTPKTKQDPNIEEPVVPAKDRLHFVNDDRLKGDFDQNKKESVVIADVSPKTQTRLVEVNDEFTVKQAPVKASANKDLSSKNINSTNSVKTSNSSISGTSTNTTNTIGNTTRHTNYTTMGTTTKNVRRIVHPEPIESDYHKSSTPKTYTTNVKTAVKSSPKIVNPVYHTVQNGENLYRISLKYNVSVLEIKQLNKLSSDRIYRGTKLRIK